MPTTKKIREEHLRVANMTRQLRAVANAQTIAEHADTIVKAMLKEDPKLEAVGIALKELLGFVQDIRGDYSAIAGHAREYQEEAASHADDLANAATIAINIDQIVIDTPHHINSDTTTGDVQRIIGDLAKEIWQRRERDGKPFRVGLIIKDSNDDLA